jgi:uncharacterized membrane protein
MLPTIVGMSSCRRSTSHSATSSRVKYFRGSGGGGTSVAVRPGSATEEFVLHATHMSMLRKLGEVVRTSYWFVPAIMIVGAIAVSLCTIWVDQTFGSWILRNLGRLHSHSPAGAMALLQAVAGSMITTAGVVFSVMVVVLALAANQFGSRVLRNYMRDRGSQFSLGMFVATFIFCLMVMRTVHGSESGADFIPELSIATAVGLAIASVAVLIYFIHHCTQFIQSENILAAVTAELRAQVELVLPNAVGPSREPRPGDLPTEFVGRCRPVRPKSSGYLQMINVSALVRLASERDLYIECLIRPGDFISKDGEMARYMAAQHYEKDNAAVIRRSFTIATYRTYLQDVDFAVQQIVLIMVRAMSPAIHDPFTAMACLDRLNESFLLIASHRDPESRHFAEEGRLRVVLQEVSMENLMDSTLATVGKSVRGDVLVSKYFMRTIRSLLGSIQRPGLRRMLRKHAVQAMQNNEKTMTAQSDLDDLRNEFQQTLRAADQTAA